MSLCATFTSALKTFDVQTSNSNLNSKKEKKLWIISCVIAVTLCTVHVGTTLKRYFDVPITTRVIVRKSNTYKIPTFVICPLLFSRNAEDFKTWDLISGVDLEFVQNGVRYKADLFRKMMEILSSACEGVKDCTAQNLGGYSLEKLNVSFDDVRFDSRITKATLLADYCKFAVNEVECEENKANGNSLLQTFSSLPVALGGKCLKITAVDELIYNSLAQGFELRFNQETRPILTINFYNNKPLGMLADYPNFIEFNSEVVITNLKKFRYLNTQSDPCVSKEEAIKCLEEEQEESLGRVDLCYLPMLNSTRHRKNCTTFNKIIQSFDKYLDWMVSAGLHSSCVRSCEDTIVGFDVREGGNNVTGASIRFRLENSVVEEYIDEYAYGFGTLLSDLAGILGFFLGVSLIHIINKPLTILRKKFF